MIIKYHLERAGVAWCGSDRGHVNPEKWFRELPEGYSAVVRNASCKACEQQLEKVGVWTKKG